MSIITNAGAGAAKYVDERTSSNKFLKKNLGKIFPDHWSFMLGEIALYSFLVLLLSGTFLALFFKPSMTEVVYNGSYVPLNGIKMSEAYASSLDISFDVRGGLLMRQIHHWAALIFIASIMVHLMRVFFTGAFRKPRELNWLIGVVLLTLGLLAGFSGYSLPDDLLSGTGLRIAEGVMLSIPVVGTYLSMFIFGGEFPGIDFISRLYTVHVLFIPGAILGLVTAHLMLVWYQKHTQYPGPGRTNDNVVGFRLFPIYTAKAGGFFFIVFGVIALLGALATVNPIWLYGPYTPDQITAGSQPDFYIGFLEGSLRMTPPIEITLWGYTLSLNILIPGLILPGLMFTAMGIYPFLEKFVTKDNEVHNLLDRPRDNATRTGLGVMALTFYAILLIGGGNDILAVTFDLSINSITRVLQVLIWVLPPLAYVATKRMCLGLQRRDRDKLLHGRESGVIRRTPEGEFYEVHAPLSVEERAVLLSRRVYEPLELPAAEDANGVRNPASRKERLRARLSRFYFSEQVPMPTAAEIAEGDDHLAHAVDHTLEPSRVTEVVEGEVSEFGMIVQSEAVPRDRTPTSS